jgi:hypothetical protein
VEFLRDGSGNHSYAADREDRILKAIYALYTAECTEAFMSVGLESPMSLVNRVGLVVGPASLTKNPTNLAYMGIPESSRAEIRPYADTTDTKGFTVHRSLNQDGRGRIFLNGTAFPAGLIGVFAHEFIHQAGVDGRKPPRYKPWQDDLSFDSKYQAVINKCVEAGQRFAE